MTPASPTRLAIVVSHPTQYYSPWFRWVAEHSGLAVRVFYLWDFGVTEQLDPRFQTSFKWDLDLLSGYESEFVPNRARVPGPERFWGFDNPTLTARLAAWRPDAVLLFGYAWASHVRVIAWTRRRRVPLLFRGDSHFLGRGRPGLRTRLALRAIYAQCAGFLVVGAANRDYFTTLGVPAQKLFFAPHSVNHALFNPERSDHQAAASALRAQLGLAPETRVVLFAGKFVPAKQPRELLEAFLALNRPGTALVFVGDGPEKEALLERARCAAAAVRFLPFANQTEMPARLLLADIFALPSRGHYETWGLAVNEALHMGVPALVSDRVGCQADLVSEGETGWVFRADDTESLRDTLARALDAVAAPSTRARLRASAAARIARYTYADTTAGLLAALDALTRTGRLSSNR